MYAIMLFSLIWIGWSDFRDCFFRFVGFFSWITVLDFFIGALVMSLRPESIGMGRRR